MDVWVGLSSGTNRTILAQEWAEVGSVPEIDFPTLGQTRGSDPTLEIHPKNTAFPTRKVDCNYPIHTVRGTGTAWGPRVHKLSVRGKCDVKGTLCDGIVTLTCEGAVVT